MSLAAGRHPSFLLLTQNLGSLEGSESSVSDKCRRKTMAWVAHLKDHIDAIELERMKLNAATTSSSSSSQQQGLSDTPPQSEEEETTVTESDEIDVVVIHMQEIGGKKFSAPFNNLLASVLPTARPNAAWCSGLLMPTENDPHVFTAMGTVIFLSKRVAPFASLLSVRHRTYITVSDDPVEYVGGNANSHFLFHGAKFSNADTSRKGYLLTSLRIGSTAFNFVNVHLFHDADNTVVVGNPFPSEYASKRLLATVEAINEIAPVVSGGDPLFVFGDFNMRLDGRGLAQICKDTTGADISVGKKKVTAQRPFWDFLEDPAHLPALLQLDKETQPALEAVASATGIELGEMPRKFLPTYMYDDSDGDGGSEPDEVVASGDGSRPKQHSKKKRGKRKFGHERLPAWCDRVMMNPAAAAIVATGGKASNSRPIATELPEKKFAYDAVGLGSMDHNAVFLLF